ncbi:hypothetical protein Dthio_PD2633 [Desulfonatronospira thiodismutans ASO3-1]|uniref:Uncharacterized protein n=1 Tax=Desulfonatronospira thiodismutans ASO3-1 TaxID=555779 RepID=D6SKL3_9BACT|nr:hypothetical protein [Desulfonatronospira thiodismutans]EFI35224.1 hypothetical protein Dthio_PD2633 [Desulfonatronospira thiodismutans ASO3-1]
MNNKETIKAPADANAPAGAKRRWARILVTSSLLLILGIGVAYLHSLPVVQEVKQAFRESGIDVSAFTYSDVEEYRDVKSGLRADPVR